MIHSLRFQGNMSAPSNSIRFGIRTTDLVAAERRAEDSLDSLEQIADSFATDAPAQNGFVTHGNDRYKGSRTNGDMTLEHTNGTTKIRVVGLTSIEAVEVTDRHGNFYRISDLSNYESDKVRIMWKFFNALNRLIPYQVSTGKVEL